ncbi:Inositol-pentakisphosphate 2-kinase [Manis javanica]|nr:Inositol-pentakisphosphate 2-kinase [Manis javanica]
MEVLCECCATGRIQAVDPGLMPSGEILQKKRENLPRVCHAPAFLGMTRCQDLFLVHLQGWKLGTSMTVKLLELIEYVQILQARCF